MSIDLWLESGEDSLSVRRFSVKDGLSALFDAVVIAASPKADLDIDGLVGRGAALRLVHQHTRTFQGIVRSAALVQAEATGLSTYEIRIAHGSWLLSQRVNHRVFQHKSIPEIVTEILGEWGLSGQWSVDSARHPKLEYRVQYGESDQAFIQRLLEEAGITCRLVPDGEVGSDLLFTDAPHREKPRQPPLMFVDNPQAPLGFDHVKSVRLFREVGPSKVALRDFDFRRRADYELIGNAAAGAGNPRLEHYRYAHGGAGAGDTSARADARAATLAAEQALAGEEASRRVVSFETNAIDLYPGTVFAIADHPHPQLAADRPLLVTELVIEGGALDTWKISGRAAHASAPYHPLRVTPRPRIDGVESAVVVGPKGHPIHTDEHGRVRVQFHWDRVGRFDDKSSTWIRVSQGWAGAGYGLLALPRVGQEVLVAFFGGDPDQPVVVGRVFNGPSPVPYKLPENATRSTWRSESVPGSDGFNELLFEDAKGRELVYLQAERNLDQLVKVDESITVGNNRSKQVGANETEVIGASQTTAVGATRNATIGGVDATQVGLRHSVTMAQAPGSEAITPTAVEMVDRRITLTTGEATITLEGPNITLDAAASILLNAASEITIHGKANIKVMSGASVRVQAQDGDVVIQGGPYVQINPERGGEAVGDLPVEAPPEVDIHDDLDLAEQQRYFNADDPHWFQRQTAAGGQWDPMRWGKPFEEFGFFHLGLVGRAAGIPAGVLLRMEGSRHAQAHGASPERGDPGNGMWGGKAPFGNDPKRHASMQKGIDHYEKNLR